MIKCLKDTGFWWTQKPLNASEAKFNMRYKTLVIKWLYKHSAPHQSSVSGDSDVARNPQRFHTADRYGSFKKRQLVGN